MLATVVKPFDSFVISATKSRSFTLSPIGIGLIVVPISTNIAWGLKNSKQVIYQTVMRLYIKWKKTIPKRSTNNKTVC